MANKIIQKDYTTQHRTLANILRKSPALPSEKEREVIYRISHNSKYLPLRDLAVEMNGCLCRKEDLSVIAQRELGFGRKIYK